VEAVEVAAFTEVEVEAAAFTEVAVAASMAAADFMPAEVEAFIPVGEVFMQVVEASIPAEVASIQAACAPPAVFTEAAAFTRVADRVAAFTPCVEPPAV
jgi:hypothetical protein